MQKFNYRIEKEQAVLIGADAIQSEVVIPATLDGYSVVGIEKKAFLGLKTPVTLVLPDTIEWIGDWAFAHCKNLQSVEIQSKSVACGRELCMGCEKLRFFGDGKNARDRLLPLLMKRQMPDYLCNPANYGTKEWYALIDKKIIEFLNQPDNAEYRGLWTFGEEDYTDRNFELENYEVEQRMQKVDLCFCRLLDPISLTVQDRQLLESYLRAHMGCGTTKETVQILTQVHASEIDYFRIYTRLSGVTQKDICELLEQLPECLPEIRSFLMMKCDEMQKTFNFFDGLLN